MTALENRFWAKVRKSDGCWLWTDKPHAPWNYGRLLVAGRAELAHRLSWEIHNGPIPPGMSVLHTCDTPMCVRPDHLWLGTHSDNMRDMAAKKRGRGRYGRETHCPQGHPYDAANTYRYKNSRQCRACRKVHTHNQHLRRKAARRAKRLLVL